MRFTGVQGAYKGHRQHLSKINERSLESCLGMATGFLSPGFSLRRLQKIFSFVSKQMLQDLRMRAMWRGNKSNVAHQRSCQTFCHLMRSLGHILRYLTNSAMPLFRQCPHAQVSCRLASPYKCPVRALWGFREYSHALSLDACAKKREHSACS